MYSTHSFTLTRFNPPRVQDRLALVSWKGLSIRDIAPYLTWTLPFQCRRGRRARQGPCTAPEGKEKYGVPLIISRNIILWDIDYLDLLESWESPDKTCLTSFDPMRAHKCFRFKNRIFP